jgi:uncharacterized membrane protein HdeD (DUF308 family)
MALFGSSAEPVSSAPHKSIPSILAIICAVVSFFIHSGFLGLLLAIAAIVLGIVGFFLAVSPRKSGGILSVLSILLGVVATVFALLRGVWHVIH